MRPPSNPPPGPGCLACPPAPPHPQDAGIRFFCQTCPYVHAVKTLLTKKVPLPRKEVDDVLGGAAAWDNADQTAERCPECANSYAYYYQIQIRGGDEPMTTFYKCTKCAHRWND